MLPEKPWGRLYSVRVGIHVQSLVPNQAERSHEQHLWAQLRTPHGQHWPLPPPFQTGQASQILSCYLGEHLIYGRGHWEAQYCLPSISEPLIWSSGVETSWWGLPVGLPTPGLHWSEGAGQAVALYSVQHLGTRSALGLHSTSIHTLLHPDLMLVPFSNNPKSGSTLFVQYNWAYSRAQLAGLGQQNFSGCTAKQCTVKNL